MDDKKLIMELGGPTKVAVRLGLNVKGGAQRVQNWLSRGIPAKVKVDRPDLFMPTVTSPLSAKQELDEANVS